MKKLMHRTRENSKPATWLAAGALLLATVMPVTTAAAGSDQWEYEATIYLWAAGIDATTETGGDIDISFNDILDDLDMTFMGGFGARKGKWSLALDTLYLDISQNDKGSETRPVLGTTVKFDADVKMKASITTFAGGYNLVDNDRVMLDLMGGARYAWVDVESKLDLTRAGRRLLTSRQAKVSGSDGIWDGIVGVRGQFNINDNWYMPYYADVGTGQSDLTWQALAGIGYRFKWGDIQLMYRYLDYEFDSDVVLEDLSMKGPLLGARFYF
jgi:hypothetical protein